MTSLKLFPQTVSWYSEAPGEEIVKSLKISAKKQKQYREALEAVELILDLRGSYVTALQRLRRIWTIQGTGTKEMRGRLEQALDYNQATDCYLIPTIPGCDPLGYVVLLREVSSICHDNLHASALDLQISGSGEGYYVAGSSKDGGRQVAVLCLNDHLFDVYRLSGRIAGKIVALTSRDQMNDLKYARTRCVFSMPEYVAGLQFDVVYLIHADKAELAEESYSAGLHRRVVSRCYLGASRAAKKLVIAASEERGGRSEILDTPLREGSLRE